MAHFHFLRLPNSQVFRLEKLKASETASRSMVINNHVNYLHYSYKENDIKPNFAAVTTRLNSSKVESLKQLLQYHVRQYYLMSQDILCK